MEQANETTTTETTAVGQTDTKATAPIADDLNLALGADESTETGVTEPAKEGAKPGELIAGKYKTQEDLIKAHKELESKLGKVSAVPEAYELTDTAKAANFAWESDEQREAITSSLKEAGIKQDQFEKLMPVYKQQVTGVIDQIMTRTDIQAEAKTLRDEWGPDFKGKIDETMEYARKNLPLEMWRTPLYLSAPGLKLLNQMMMEKRGPELINSTDSGSTNAASLQSKLDQIVADPSYYSHDAKGKQLRDEAAQVSARISGQK